MATPKAVQRQLEQAEALQAQLAAEAQQQSRSRHRRVSAASASSHSSRRARLRSCPGTASTPRPRPQSTGSPGSTRCRAWHNAEIPALRALTRTQESEIATLKAQVQALMATAKPAEPAKPSFDPDEVERFRSGHAVHGEPPHDECSHRAALGIRRSPGPAGLRLKSWKALCRG